MSARHAGRVLAMLAIVMTTSPLQPHAAVHAQPDTLSLHALQRAALEHDPRGVQARLLAAQSALRLGNLAAERLPALSVNGQAQYQSAVIEFPFQLPGGVAPPAQPHDSYDAHLDVRERLYDPARRARGNVERAELALAQSRLQTTLYSLRATVSDAFFSALLLGEQRAELQATITDLDARLHVARERVRLGSALPSEADMLEAELLRRRQSADALAADRDAALVVLADLTGQPVTTSSVLALPDLAGRVDSARAALTGVRARPEFAQYASSRALLREQEAVIAARDKPRLSAFGRTGYGRPGLNPLGRDFNAYWLAGLQMEWTPFTWGSTGRDREVLALQEQSVTSDEAAFGESLRRGIVRDLATIDRLERAQAEDDAIIALRDAVLRETRHRYAEGVITSADYGSRETDALAARLARAGHRTALAQARARVLITLGLEMR